MRRIQRITICCSGLLCGVILFAVVAVTADRTDRYLVSTDGSENWSDIRSVVDFTIDLENLNG